MSEPSPSPAERPNYRAEAAQSSAPKAAPWYLRGSVLLTVAAVGIAAWAVYRTGLTDLVTGSAAPHPVAPASSATVPASTSPGSVESRRREADAVAADTARRDLLARAKVAQRHAVELADEVGKVSAEGVSEVDRWESEVVALLTNDTGRFLASRPHLVRAFRAVFELERPTRASFEQVTAQVDLVAASARTALNAQDNAWEQTTETEKKLSALLSDARAKRDVLVKARQRVEAIVGVAKATGVTGSVTLQAATQAIDYQEALEAAAGVEAAREVARREADELMARTKGEAVRQAGISEAKRVAATAEVERTKVDLEAEALRTKAEKERLRAKYRSTEVQQDLAIFLAKGYSQPIQAGLGGFERTGTLGPVSFSRLKTSGALDPSPTGLSKLLRVGSEPARGNDRPKWKFHPFELRQDSEPFVRRVQGLLNELGPVLVEDGLLAP